MRVFVFLFLLSIGLTSGIKAQDGLKAGDRIPEISVNSADGDPIAINEINSKLILIDFWAGYCRPCIKSIRNILKPLYDSYSRNQLEIIGINVDTSPELWVKSAEKAGIPWTQVYDHDRSLLKAFGVQAIPRYFLVDENKKIIETDLKSSEIKKVIKKYLGQ